MTKESYMSLADFQDLWTDVIKPWVVDNFGYESKSAASGGADVSLVTTGEKYTWNSKQDALSFNQTPSSSNKVATMADIPSVPVTSVAGKTGAVTLAKGDVGLGNVDNTADADKSVNYATTAGSAPASDVYPWAKASTKPSYSYSEISNTPSSLPASDVYSWAKAATKPSYAYSEIGYTVNPVSNSSTSVSLAGTTPLHVVTTSVSITAVTLSVNPAEGHSCHVIFANGGNTELTVSMTHDSTNRVCPGGTNPDPLTIPVGGYVEIDFLTANSKVYVRGVE